MTHVAPCAAASRIGRADAWRARTRSSAVSARRSGRGRSLSLSIGPTGITLASLPRVLTAMVTGRTTPPAPASSSCCSTSACRACCSACSSARRWRVSGAMMQGMFRNPLADPGLIGVSSGAALAAVATIALGNGLAAPLDPRRSASTPCPSQPSSAASRPRWCWWRSSAATASWRSARCCWRASRSAR